MSRRQYAIVISVLLLALGGSFGLLMAQAPGGYSGSASPPAGYPSTATRTTGYPTTGYPSTGYPSTAEPSTEYRPAGNLGNVRANAGYPGADARPDGYPAFNQPASPYPGAGYPGATYRQGEPSGMPPGDARPWRAPRVSDYPGQAAPYPAAAPSYPGGAGRTPTYPDRGYPDRGYPDRGDAGGGYPDRTYPDGVAPYANRGQAGAVPPVAPGPPAVRPPAVGRPTAGPPVAGPPVAGPPARPNSELFEPARVIARVGNEPILAGDLLPQIKRMLEPYKDKASEEELRGQEEKLLQQLLRQSIEYKLLYQDFLRTLPADKRKEIISNAEQKLFEEYDENQLPKDLKTHEVSTAAELDAKLRSYGSSLAKQKRDFMEQQLARAQLSRNVEFNAEITHDEMLTYYREHLDDYQIDPAARWEQLTVKFDNFDSKAAAYRFIANMGNEVLRGAPLSAVARRHSQEPYASDGGVHEWTEQGSLVSVPMDRALFSLPVGRMSQIIEDDQGFHIIRVLERRDAGKVKFSEVQTEIKDTIRKERRSEEIKDYLQKLKKSIYVWNVFEDPAEQAP